MFMTEGIKHAVVKAGHHLIYNRHIVSDHKGVYVHFKADRLFDIAEMDWSHLIHRRLALHKRDVVGTVCEA